MKDIRLEINPRTNKLQARDITTGRFKGVSNHQKDKSSPGKVAKVPDGGNAQADR